ncbi:hypothetical protein TRIHO_00010 [Tritonibacter horizontis]|uniref:Uncharacterized protein n=1 Tax=Tritonibacter horizontis TaxID=1768241 RepID=A0A132C3C1_9RHOB|nr:hypothetical protein TRIHO_00010 [Tritonibacter horizontis]
MPPRNTGTQRQAAAILSGWLEISRWISARSAIASPAPISGDSIQLAAMLLKVIQSTAPKPTAAMLAPMIAPMMLWVVETGAPIQVARLTQSAEAAMAAIIALISTSGALMAAGWISRCDTVATTSLPPSSAPAVSARAAAMRAAAIGSALAPTAGPMLLATSLAPMLIAR